MKSAAAHYLPKAEFDAIYGRVPRLAVDLIVRTPNGAILIKRGIEPCKGQWHTPGGTVMFGESLTDAAHRIAQKELGIKINLGKLIGYFEYPEMAADGYKGWPVSIVFEATIAGGEPQGSDQGEEINYFTSTPKNTIADQAKFLNEFVFTK